MTLPTQDLEAVIVAAGATKAPRITPANVEANIVSEHYFTAADAAGLPPAAGIDYIPPRALGPLDLLTFCVLVLRNGFTVTGESACVSPENFDAGIGRRVARDNAVAKIWPLMGYELRSKLAATPTDFRDRVRAEHLELEERIAKLVAFTHTEGFKNLPEPEKQRLYAQHGAMRDYSNCLSDRIAAFPT